MKFVPLKNVLTFIRGVTFKPDDLLEQGDKDSIVCLRTKNIQKELDLTDVMVIPTSIIEKNDAKILQKSDILISSANSWQLVGKCVRVPELPFPATLGGFISNLRAKPEVVNANYLYHWLVSPNIQHEIRHLGRQTTNISNLDRVRFLELKIPLPPLETQKQIAQVLATADQLRKDCQQVEQELNALAESVFFEMFGDPVTNPKGWEIKKLKDISHIQIGPFGTQLHKEDYIENGIPLINPTHIKNGKLIPNIKLTIPVSKHEELPQYHLEVGDIIMGCRGEMGRCAVITEREEGWLCGTGSLIIRPHNGEIFSAYLCKLLSGKAISSHLEAESQGATMLNLNKTIVGNINIPVPSDDTLKKLDRLEGYPVLYTREKIKVKVQDDTLDVIVYFLNEKKQHHCLQLYH